MDGVLNWLWQGVTVAAVLLVMLQLLERTRANIRYIVCGVTLTIVLAIPALRWLPAITDEPQLSMTQASSPVVSLPVAFWTSSVAMFGLWSLWAAAQTILLLRALVALRRVRRTSRPLPAEVERGLRHWMRVRGERRRARLVLSDAVGSAAVLGCGRPIIAVAPAIVERLSADELDRVVIHEWAHVQRRDDVAYLLQHAVRVLAGWHPAVWWIDRRLSVEREVACDETTVAVTGSAKSYASCLLRLADLSATSRLAAAPGVLSVGSLRHRVSRIVSHRALASTTRSRGLAAATVVLLLMLSTAVGGYQLFAAVALQEARFATSLVAGVRQHMPAAPISADVVAEPQTTGRKTTVPVARRGVGVPEILPQTASRTTAEGSVPQQPVEQPADTNAPHAPTDNRDGATVDVPPAGDETRSTVSATPPASEPDVDPRPNWTSAGDAGVAIGQKSKDAGLATAGFFTRFARRVAGKF